MQKYCYFQKQQNKDILMKLKEIKVVDMINIYNFNQRICLIQILQIKITFLFFVVPNTAKQVPQNFLIKESSISKKSNTVQSNVKTIIADQRQSETYNKNDDIGIFDFTAGYASITEYEDYQIVELILIDKYRIKYNLQYKNCTYLLCQKLLFIFQSAAIYQKRVAELYGFRFQLDLIFCKKKYSLYNFDINAPSKATDIILYNWVPSTFLQQVCNNITIIWHRQTKFQLILFNNVCGWQVVHKLTVSIQLIFWCYCLQASFNESIQNVLQWYLQEWPNIWGMDNPIQRETNKYCNFDQNEQKQGLWRELLNVDRTQNTYYFIIEINYYFYQRFKSQNTIEFENEVLRLCCQRFQRCFLFQLRNHQKIK